MRWVRADSRPTSTSTSARLAGSNTSRVNTTGYSRTSGTRCNNVSVTAPSITSTAEDSKTQIFGGSALWRSLAHGPGGDGTHTAAPSTTVTIRAGEPVNGPASSTRYSASG